MLTRIGHPLSPMTRIGHPVIPVSRMGRPANPSSRYPYEVGSDMVLAVVFTVLALLLGVVLA